MAAGFTKILGVLNDSKRRSKRRGSDASGVSNESSQEPIASSSSSSYSGGSSKPSSLLLTPPPSPSISDSPDASPIDGWYRPPHHRTYSSSSSSSDYSQDGGDIDIDVNILREWTCTPPSAQFQLKRMGRGSRGRTRPTLALSTPEKHQSVREHAEHYSDGHGRPDWI
ncbi:hypothetical protein L218DRAFT_1079042 [Marasmius fiardii PR-910]|nr:hypothetical protein L218DRAFT_1079042 [Marasmius fiardii PR-910]